MSTWLQLMLISHVLLGLGGVIALYAVWTGLLKAQPNVRVLKRSSLIGLVLIVGSWLTAGYYYTHHYGRVVRAGIVGGPSPWVHEVVMEWKEHVFLLLPFLAALLFVALLTTGDSLAKDAKTKRALTFLAGFTAWLGILVALTGIIISGAART